MTHIFETSFIVKQDECDMYSRIKPASLLRRTQQVSTAHCNSSGLNNQLYEKTNTAFLLAKSQLEIFENILSGDEVKAKTTAYGPLRAIYMRIVEFYVNDKLMAVSDGRWILIDTQTKRILRRPPDEIDAFFPQQPSELPPLAIEKTEQIEPVAVQKALFSMCDINTHINNTVYADIVLDNLPDELYGESSAVKKLVMIYHNEIPFKANFEISRGKISNNSFYFTCSTGENRNFEANLLF